jgi:Uma2 family endonuclease
MAETAQQGMTADEFVRWDDGTDARYELVDGVVVAMAPATDAHGTIAMNAGMEIGARLRSREPCRAIVEAGIRLDGRNHFKADVAATCAGPRGQLYVEEPFLVVEIISEGSERDDLGRKVRRYIELPTIREIWLIDSRERWVQIWRRSEDCWIVTLPLRGESQFTSDALGAKIALEALYRNSGL